MITRTKVQQFPEIGFFFDTNFRNSEGKIYLNIASRYENG